jgi:alpha-amylase
MKKLNKLRMILSILSLVTFLSTVHAQNDAMMQAFYWNLPVDKVAKNGTWWDNLNGKANELKNAGINGIWIPAPSKGNWGIEDMGYGIFDHYDLGNYLQRGTTETRFGSRAELQNMITTMHSTLNGKPRMNVYADVVLNHVYSDDTNEEINPAVKQYVFDQAIRGGTQYVPYPTNEIKWVIPASAGSGDYYIKIKGYVLNWGASQDERAYDVQMDWTGGGFNGIFSWETEPNNGGGASNVFPASGRTVRGIISSSSDVDEYKVTVSSAHDIIIRLTARKNDANWSWADQVNGYYPFEVWHNGVNLASSSLQARTNTSVGYVNHTGTGEANYTWHYTDFHPVDAADFLTNWEWNGGNSAIIPNTKAFGNDFNTYSTTVQTRLNNWGYWMANTVGFDGFRLDFVRGYQTDFIRSWIANLPLLSGSQRFIVGEYWGPDYRIKDWVNGLAAGGVDADGFDFPLKTSLTDLCNGNGAGFDMRWLNHAGMVRNNSGNALPGTSVVTWIENHDTGKEHDKWITKDWKLGYAYVLTHEGRPCIFYPHYYGVTLVDNGDATKTVTIPSTLKDDINKLLFVRKTYLGGTLQVLSEVGNPYPAGDAYNLYVARRQGNGTKSGAIVVINNHDSAAKSLWVDSSPAGYASWAGVTLVNAFNSAQTTVVQADGRVNVSAPARSYTVWVKQSEYVTYVAPGTTREVIEQSAIDESEIEKTGKGLIHIYPNPANQQITISTGSPEKTYSVAMYNSIGELVMNKEVKNNSESYDLSTGHLKEGYYVIKVNSGKRSASTRVHIKH